MDWLQWTIRAFTVLGGVAVLVFALVGFYTLLSVWRSSLILWSAKKRWLAQQRAEAGYTKKSEPTQE